MYLRNVFDCLLAWIPRAMSNNAPNLKQKLLQIQKKNRLVQYRYALV